jgi:hypothetical protein
MAINYGKPEQGASKQDLRKLEEKISALAEKVKQLEKAQKNG